MKTDRSRVKVHRFTHHSAEVTVPGDVMQKVRDTEEYRMFELEAVKGLDHIEAYSNIYDGQEVTQGMTSFTYDDCSEFMQRWIEQINEWRDRIDSGEFDQEEEGGN